jgi:hypothetical protein
MVGGCLHFSGGGEFRGEFFDTTGRIAIATRPVLGSVSTVEDARLGAAIRCGTIASAAGQLFFPSCDGFIIHPIQRVVSALMWVA